jgi:hypothetical protein
MRFRITAFLLFRNFNQLPVAKSNRCTTRPFAATGGIVENPRASLRKVSPCSSAFAGNLARQREKWRQFRSFRFGLKVAKTSAVSPGKNEGAVPLATIKPFLSGSLVYFFTRLSAVNRDGTQT